MPVGVSYEIAAVMISFIILIYFNKTRKIAVFQDEILLLMVVMNALTAVCDIIKHCLVAFLGPENVASETLTACSTGYFMTHLLILPLMCIYILCAVKSWREMHILFKISFLLPLLLAMALIFSNIWSGAVFTHTADGVYHRGKGILLIYLAAGYYVVYLIGMIIYCRKQYSFTKKIIFSVEIALCLATMLIQFLFPKHLVETSGLAIALLILLFFIQDPSAQTDRVTGAYSKTAFYSVMKYNCLSRKKKELYVIMLDNLQREDVQVDYTILDDTMAQLTRFLQKLHKYSNVYRLDKYSFCVEAWKISENQKEKLLKALQGRFGEPWGYLESHLILKAKIGRISIPEELYSIDQLLGVLDYMETEEYTEEILRVDKYDLKEIERAKRITDALAQSIEYSDFDMRYTPICYLKDKEIVGAEITVRFYEESLGYVYDDEILSFAERAGHVANLGQRIFEHTCRMLGEEHLEEMGIRFICIQILPAMCLLQGLSDKLIDIMEEYHINPKMIYLQISEAAIADATGVFRENMQRLADKGVKFCLTGYGSGYTNISAIYDLPFSMIKFSRSFVQSALMNEKARITLESLLALSKELEMETRVPGIDDLDFFDMVSDMACDYAEGDYFFKQLDLVGFKHIIGESANDAEMQSVLTGRA